MSETNVQLFPGVFRTTQGGSNPDFFLHSAGRVGIGNDAPGDVVPPGSSAGTTFKLNVTGHANVSGTMQANKYYGDGSTLSGVAAVIGGYWDLDQANNNIKYDVGNVGIGGAAGTEKLTVHGDLNLDGGNLKLNGQNPVYSNWTPHTNGIYRSTNVGIGGVPSSTEKLTVYGDLNLNGGNLKLNGQNPVYSNWTPHTNGIYRSTNVGIGGVPSSTEALKVHGNVEVSNTLSFGSAVNMYVDTIGYTQHQKLTASDGASSDYFGTSVSIDGDTMVIGAYYDYDNGSRSGSAYVFTRDTAGDLASGWTQVAKLTAGDGASSDYFGRAVSIDGDTMVIGAYLDDDKGTSSGSAYIFTRDTAGNLASNWTQVAKLTADDGAANDWFGYSVSIDGDTVVIGAYNDDDDGISSGSAYVFTRDLAGDLASGWTQVVKLTADDGAANDYFGWSVSIDGDTMVIGAHLDDDRGTNSGSVYVFTRDTAGDLASSWTQVAKLTAGDGAAYDSFGYSVSIDGDTVVIGAYYDDDNGSSSGSAYVFTRDLASGWTEVAKLTANDGALNDRFGRSVSIDSDTIVIGAYYDDDKGSDSGSAYVFRRITAGNLASGWTQVAKLTASDGAVNDYFGESVSIDGDTVVIGAYQDDDDGYSSGSAYIFIDNPSSTTLAVRGGTTFFNKSGTIQHMRINESTGDVGIGIRSPLEKLHVNGNMIVDGDIRYISIGPVALPTLYDHIKAGRNGAGIYPIVGKQGGTTVYNVYCEPDIYGGGWMCFAQIPRIPDTLVYSAQGRNWNLFTDAVGDSAVLLKPGTGTGARRHSTFSVPMDILSTYHGYDIDVLLMVYGEAFSLYHSGVKCGAIWRGVYLSQAFDSEWRDPGATVGKYNLATSHDGVDFVSRSYTLYNHPGWDFAISTEPSTGEGSYGHTVADTGGWIVHSDASTGGFNLFCNSIRGSGNLHYYANADVNWEYVRIFVRPSNF